ncbi:MAG: hypothetical protein IPF42_04505 [Candidatus Microthrix sp.]|nr:hypothetical protein [Candidatus Microthrix sp.]
MFVADYRLAPKFPYPHGAEDGVSHQSGLRPTATGRLAMTCRVLHRAMPTTELRHR